MGLLIMTLRKIPASHSFFYEIPKSSTLLKLVIDSHNEFKVNMAQKFKQLLVIETFKIKMAGFVIKMSA